MSALDWSALMRAGLSALRLKPSDFWALTPVEFLLLTGEAGASSPTSRETLERLVQLFPDERKKP
jgi:uncharacterized phage protein (TIGR02216 family)